MNEIHINDVFWTFQGEGMFAGRRALFVRMPFCNLKCSWCDTEFNSFDKWTTESFMNVAAEEKSRFAVITGGEPMMHKHTTRVIHLLKQLNFYIACETNGTFPIIPGIDFPTVSPKRDADYKIHPEAFKWAKEFKYVVDRFFDFSVLERNHPLILDSARRYSLSPEWNERDANLHKIFEYITEHPEWRISLQTHKIMDIK